jgi:diguanylate cyclase (GGDEF)-like protein/PAS domain S-box-containing protein
MTVRRKADLTRLPFWAAVFVALICTAILTLSVLREWDAREVVLKTAEVNMANLARSLTQHAEDSFDLLDASIIGVVTRLEVDGPTPYTLATLQKVIEARKTGLKRINALIICDENGNWLASTGVKGPNLSTREYFLHHMQSDTHGAYMGHPVKSNTSGEWITTMSRRFNHHDGSFAGVVIATVSAEYFSRFYRQFDTGANSAIALERTDGFVMARSPDDGTYAGRDISDRPLFRDPNLQSSGGAYYFRSPLDGLQRLSFYKRSDRFPFLVLATVERDEVLAPWREAAIIRMSFVVVLIGLIAIVGLLLVRQMVARQGLMSTLAAREADFRLLAEESSDMVTRIGFDGQLIYVSPSSARVVGWSPDQLTGTPALAGVNADDLPAIDETVGALRRGDITDARVVYRTRHRDVQEVWIESTMRVTRKSGTNEIDGVVAISRDVTQQKNAEQKLGALAIRDGLTGLANRGRFDERLQEEWARALREGTPLSLLMIDVDHFKKFNDQYGHPAGDACLRSVARTLRADARRPGDLAARYGGEEFVLLLPNTEAAGCKLVGERVRQELRRLDIVHAMNPPTKRVTVSLGGATIWPNPEFAMETSSLVDAADRALYAAKDRGRDRLMMSDEAVMRFDLEVGPDLKSDLFV